MDHCPRCGSEEIEVVNWMHDDSFDMFRCLDCDFTWDEGPEDLQNEEGRITSD